jgi:hypothetical protein
MPLYAKCVLSLLLLIVIIESDSNNNSSIIDEFFIMQQIEIEILFQWVMYFLRMEYAIKLKLFKVITFIVTVKLINKIIRSA